MSGYRMAGTVVCWECGDTHPAEYAYESPYGQGPMYEVVCPRDGLSDWYTTEVVTFPRMPIGARSEVRQHGNTGQAWDGSERSYSWRRDFNGRPYTFRIIVMRSGEVRWSVSRYNDYCREFGIESALKWGCAWSPAHFVTFGAHERMSS